MRKSSLLRSVTTLAHFLALLALGSQVRADVTFGVNAIVNPGAEAGAASGQQYVGGIPGWQPTNGGSILAYGGGNLSATAPGAGGRGNQYFAEGGWTGWTQLVDLRNQRLVIQNGGVTCAVGGWFGGVDDSDRRAALRIEFLSATFTSLGVAGETPASTAAERGNVSGLLQRSTVVAVPADARYANVSLVFSNLVGAGYKAAADDLSVVFSNAALPPPTGIVNRWTFDCKAGPIPDGRLIIDSVGGAHAEVKGAGAAGSAPYGRSRALVLPGGPSATAAYVDLPNGLLSSKTAATLEMWLTVPGGNANYARSWDFGTGTAGEITGPGGTATGTNSLHGYLGLPEDGTHWEDAAILPSGNWRHELGASVSAGSTTHAVWTFDNSTPGTTAVRLYRDGVLRTSATVARDLSTLNDVNNWLGRSNWTAGNNTAATFHEVRLYNRVLSAEDVNLSRLAGPDAAETDTDGDGMPNGWELVHALDPNSAADAATDYDSDGVSNLTEFHNSTDANLVDTDADGLNDNVETNTGTWLSASSRGTNPLLPDSDSDGLADNVETNTGTFVSASNTGTNPNIADTDDDGYNDGYEVANPTPTDPNTPEPGNAWASHVSEGNIVRGNVWADNQVNNDWTWPPNPSLVHQNVWGKTGNWLFPGSDSKVTISSGTSVVMGTGQVWSGPGRFDYAPWLEPNGQLKVRQLNLDGGTLTIVTGSMLINGNSRWAGGALVAGIQDQGGVTQSGIAEITGDVTVRGMLNTNIIRLTGGLLRIDGNSSAGRGLLIRSSDFAAGGDPSVAVLSIQTDTQVLSNSLNAGLLENRGVIRKSGTNGTTAIKSQFTNYDLGENNLDGVLEVQDGRLKMEGPPGSYPHVYWGLDARVSPGAVLELGNNAAQAHAHLVHGRMHGAGGGKVQLTGTLHGGNPGVVFDFPPGMFEFAGGYLAGGEAGQWPRNVGEITLTANSGYNTFLQNDGVFNVRANLAGAGNGGVFYNGEADDTAPALLDFQTDATLYSGSARFRNYGTVRKSGGTGTAIVDVQGGVQNEVLPARPGSGRWEVSSGTLRVNNPGIGNTRIKSMEVALSNGGILEWNRGWNPDDSGSGPLTNVCAVSGGTMRLLDAPNFSAASYNRTVFRTAPGAVVEAIGTYLYSCVNEGSMKLNGTYFNQYFGVPSINKGLLVVTGSAAELAGAVNEATAAAGSPVAIPEIRLEGAVDLSTGFNTLPNHGLIRKTGAGTSRFRQGSLRNTGTIRVEQGEFAMNTDNGAFSGQTYSNGVLQEGRYEILDGAILSSLNASIFDNQASILIEGTGSMPHFNLRTNSGTLQLAGKNGVSPDLTTSHSVCTNTGLLDLAKGSDLNASNAFTLGAASHLRVAIAGTGAEEYSQITAAEAVTVNGLLELNFALSVPVATGPWRILSGSSRAGQFSSVRFVNLPANYGASVGYATNGVDVSLVPVNPANTLATWTASQSFPNAGAAALLADPDHDGSSNLLEAALGSNPQNGSSSDTVISTTITRDGRPQIVLTYTRPGPATRPSNIIYINEQSTTLGNWSSVGLIEEVSPVDAQGKETVIVRLPSSSEPDRIFLQVRIQQTGT